MPVAFAKSICLIFLVFNAIRSLFLKVVDILSQRRWERKLKKIRMELELEQSHNSGETFEDESED